MVRIIAGGFNMLKRALFENIEQWLEQDKQALLVTGARQIGKTYLIREVLNQHDCDYVELNFIEQPELISFFEESKNASELLMRLSVAAGRILNPGKTIFFFDEIQEFKDIVTRIKFLVDDGNYKYIMSGSLLGVELRDLRSVPVGYMQLLEMYPMNFMEFTWALGISQDIIERVEKCYKSRIPVDDFIHEKMLDIFYLYLIIGGMPQAVVTYLETNDLNRVTQIQESILKLYKQDFTKYETQYKLRLREIYDAIPSELDAKNKRFKLNLLGNGINYDRVANDFLWLKDAGVALPVYNIQEPKLPLLLNVNRSLFKLFYSDVGLLTSQYSNQVKMQILQKSSSINNGALFENVVAQELVSSGITPYYFNSKQQGELDFVVELDGKVLPIEVKSGKDYKKHCALNNVLKNDNYRISEAFILNNQNVEVDNQRIYLPVYMTMFIKESVLDTALYKIDLSSIQ